jgi:hypothetical protein
MKQRLVILETEISILKNENELHRKFKHETNGHLQSQNGELNIIKNHHKDIVGELVLLRSDFKEAMSAISDLIKWKLSIKFMLVGGAAMASVGSTVCFVAYLLVKMYLDYKK